MKARNKILSGAKIYFEQFVDRQPASSEKPLPLTHTTDAYDLRDIISDKEIKPRYCGIFEQDLSYFFYARPAYRKNGETQANSLAAYAPIILIFKPSLSEKAIAAFPFDSGGFKNEMYTDLTHHRMSVKDFGLHPSYERIGKLVSCFFGGNKSYYNQDPASGLKFQKDEHEAESYKELITYRGKNDRDDRSSTIEMVFNRSTPLKDNLLAVVAPNSFLKDKAIKARLETLGVPIRPYSDGDRLTPASRIPLLVDVVRHFYIKQGILKK
jgi:hypothetical protein